MHLLDLVRGIEKEGHSAIVCFGGTGVVHKAAIERGIDCISLKHLVREISPINDFLAIFELRREIRAAKPDLIHLHSSKAGLIGRLAAIGLRIPVIYTAHGWAYTTGVSKLKSLTYRVLERFASKLSDKIIAVSNFDRTLAIQNKVVSEEKIVTIHNGIPAIADIATPLRSDVIKIIMVARFESPKNQLDLIRAAGMLTKGNWKLEFVGDGPLLDRAMKYVATLGLQNDVTFVGARFDVPQLLRDSNIFVLISDWEGFPLTILEAMRAGLPIIASDVGGVSEALNDNNNGFLIPKGDVSELAAKLQILIDDRHLRNRMGEAGRLRFMQEFHFDSMLKRTISLYKELASEAS